MISVDKGGTVWYNVAMKGKQHMKLKSPNWLEMLVDGIVTVYRHVILWNYYPR